MRVQIDHSEKQTGLFSKTTHHVVTTQVQFSEEEKHIIQSRKLEDTIVLERGVPSDQEPRKFVGMEELFNLRISKLVSGADSYAVATPMEAKQYEAELTQQLKLLKQYIEENADVGEKSTTFEL